MTPGGMAAQIIHFRWLGEPRDSVWCSPCALPSGVAFHAVLESEVPSAHYPVVIRVGRCVDCGGEV